MEAVLESSVSLWLPRSYRDKVEEEQVTNVEVIDRHLRACLLLGDIDRGARFWVRSLSSAINLSQGSESQLVSLVPLLVQLTTSSDVDLNLRTKCARTLTQILRKCKKSSISLPWKDLYLLLSSQFASSRMATHNGQANLVYYASALRELIVVARDHFPEETFEDLLALTEREWQPHSNTIFRAQGALSLFLPGVKTLGVLQKQLLEDIFTRWQWIDCSEWDYHWLAILARLAKSSWLSTGAVAVWSPHISAVYTTALEVLELSLGGSKLPKPNKKAYPHECYLLSPNHMETRKIRALAKLLVYTISDASLPLFEKLMHTLESYYYPSNSGSWSDRLAQLLSGLCQDITKRIFKERKAKHILLREEEIARFIAALRNPLRHALFSKGEALPASARKGYQYLAYIEPTVVFTDLMELLYLALDTLTATHQTVCAIDTLSHVVHALLTEKAYGDGHRHLSTFLQLVLPGLDPNDARKTGASLAFCSAVLSCLPLVKGVSEDDGTLLLLESLAEWPVLLLDRLFLLLEHMEEPSKKEHSQYYFRKLFQTVIDQLFMQSSTELFLVLLRKLVKFVSANILPNAENEIAYACSAASKAQPELSLSLLLPLFWDKLLKKDHKELRERGDTHMKWYIKLLSAVLRYCGENLLPHREALVAFCELAVIHSSRAVAKPVMKVLRNLLQSLCTFYPSDFRSLPPTIWQSAEFEKEPWKWWGYQQKQASDAEISWHEPTGEEVQFAAELVLRFLKRPCDFFRDLTADSRETTKISKYEIWRNLQLLCSILKGAATLLPDLQEESLPKMKGSLQYAVPLKNVTVASGTFDVPSLSKVRLDLASLLHDICSKISLPTQDSSNLSQLCKVYDAALNYRGIRYSKLKWRKQYYKLSKAKYKSIASLQDDRTSLPRRLLVERAFIKHLAREEQRVWEVPHSVNNKILLQDLVGLSAHASPVIRQKAQDVFQSALHHFPMWKREFVRSSIKQLNEANVPEEKLIGHARLLMNKGIMRFIWRNWRLLSPFMIALANGYVHKEMRVQNQFTELFLLFCATSYPLPVSISSSRIVEDHTDILQEFNITNEAIKGAETQREHENQKREALLNTLVSSLLDIVEHNTVLHWRYQLVIACCQLFLLREVPRPKLNVVSWFLKGTISDIQGLRHLSRMGLNHILKIWKPTSDAPLPVSKQPCSKEEHDSFLQVISTFFLQSKNVTQFLHYLTQDHDIKNEDSEGLAEKVVNSFRRGGKSFVEEMQQDVAAYVLKLIQSPTKQWPETINPSFVFPTNSFSLHNAHLLKGLFQLLHESEQSGFISHVQETIGEYSNVRLSSGAASSELERRHCTAAEVFGAMIRASKHFVSKEMVASMWAFWLPLLEQIILYAPLECTRNWLVGLRFAVSGQHIQRVEPLCNKLLAQLVLFDLKADEIPSMSSLVHCRVLQFISCLMSELTWQAKPMATRVLDQLVNEKVLSYPYRQVRLELAQLLLICFKTLWNDDKTHELLSTVIETIIVSSKNSSIGDAREIMLHFVSTGISEGLGYSLLSYLPLTLGPTLSVLTDSDKELVEWAKRCSALQAQVLYTKPGPLEQAATMVLALLKSENMAWHSRAVLLPFLQIFIYNHSFFLPVSLFDHLQDAVIHSLEDPSNEVRELACSALTSLTVPADTLTHEALAKRFVASLQKGRAGKIQLCWKLDY